MNQIINTDRELIIKYRELIIKCLNREFKDDHPAVYLYVYGHARTKNTAILNLMKYAIIVFYNCFDDTYLEKHIVEFLNYKKEQHDNGEIEVKPFYFNLEKPFELK
jgi:hypothetical protein